MRVFSKISFIIFFIFQTLLLIYEFIYLLFVVGVFGAFIGIFFFPVCALLLPIYMFVVDGIWFPLVITYGGIVFNGIIGIINDNDI